MHDGMPVAIELPQQVTLEIVETEPAMKGQTASSSYKPAMLSNGVRTMVPPHIGAGTRDRRDDRGRLLRRTRQGLTISRFIPVAPQARQYAGCTANGVPALVRCGAMPVVLAV